jgi:long-chain fatty acid transport protein
MKKSILGSAITAALLGASQVMAGGLWLNEFGDFAGGRASAGASAGIDGAATIAHNAASATRIEGDQLFVSGGAYLPDIKFDVEYTSTRLGDNNGGSAGVTAPAISMAYVHNIDDSKWSTGVYLGGFAGAGLEYNDDWTGRYSATEVNLLLMILAPTAAYQLTDRLSVGASAQVWYSSFEQKLALPRLRPGLEDGRAKLDGDDTGVSFTLGAMYELSERTRFGIHYQHKIDAKWDGNLKVNPSDIDVSTDTELTMAPYIRASVYQQLDEQWSVHFTVGWDKWSELDNIFIAGPERGAGLDTNWDDTYHYAWGAEYQLNDKWAFTSGVAYDTNPVNARDRRPELPVDRQIRYAVGTRYQLKENLTVGGYVNYADLGKGRIHAEGYGGDYQDNGVLQLAVNLDWKL